MFEIHSIFALGKRPKFNAQTFFMYDLAEINSIGQTSELEYHLLGNTLCNNVIKV